MYLIYIHKKLADLHDRLWRTRFFRPRADILLFSERKRGRYQSAYEYWYAIGRPKRLEYMEARKSIKWGKR